MVEGGGRDSSGQPLRIAYFGTPQFAVPTLQRLLASRHAVVGVVTQPDRPRGRGHKMSDSPVKTLALQHGLTVLQPTRLRDPSLLDAIGSWQPDLGVVAAYGRLIPDELLELPRLGMINVHASLLPKYRGAAPVHRAVIDGETETGVTIMRVVHELDAGNMLATVKRPIGPDETSDIIERDLSELGATLLVQVVDRLAEGPVEEERQDFMLATYAPKVTKEEGLIDWTLPARFIHNRVRGLYPWPHAHTHVAGKRLIVLATRVEDEPTADLPGTVVAASPDAVQVATGHQGRIAIERLQLEGRRPMSAREFLAGHPLRPGARFGAP
jgi:methionyl-tRNA formyltransferase